MTTITAHDAARMEAPEHLALTEWLRDHDVDPDQVLKITTWGRTIWVSLYELDADGRKQVDPKDSDKPLTRTRRVKMRRPLPEFSAEPGAWEEETPIDSWSGHRSRMMNTFVPGMPLVDQLRQAGLHRGMRWIVPHGTLPPGITGGQVFGLPVISADVDVPMIAMSWATGETEEAR